MKLGILKTYVMYVFNLKVKLHSIVAWISNNSLLKTGATFEV